ncbi:MAG: hypothetical protein JWP27_2412 [Flaviaesturariibacter sp.]|nr:hypothetical protein [Flaviaesturariibacter sp.]
MTPSRISRTELAVLLLVGLSIIAGYILLFIDVSLFERFTVEDGLVEWLTVFGLLLGSFTCFRRVVTLRRSRPTIFLIFLILMGLVLFFGAGEEVSWGQRLFGIQSPEYFKEHNAQGETNIHNLLVDGVKLNRIIFTVLLAIVLGIYILLVPFLYKRKNWMRRLVDHFGVPLPQPYQILAFLLMFLLVQLIPHMGKRDEISEEGTALFLYLIIAFPLNRDTFRPGAPRDGRPGTNTAISR